MATKNLAFISETQYTSYDEIDSDNESLSTPGEPMLLVEFEFTNTNLSPNANAPFNLKVNTVTLASVVKKCADLPISIIIISGSSGSGKTFFANSLQNYLSRNEPTSWPNAHTRSEELHGNYSPPETKGIWIYSEPLRISGPVKDTAVILMDTQGIELDSCSTQEFAATIGFTMFASSIALLNFSKELPQDLLNNLIPHMNLGIAIRMDDGHNVVPFQSLGFMVRDWNSPDVFNYGLSKGLKYVENTYSRGTLRKLRQKLLVQYQEQNIFCSLLPYIGESVLMQPQESQEVKPNHNFIKEMHQIFKRLTNTPIVKQFLGRNMLGKDFSDIITSFVTCFNSGITQPCQIWLTLKNRLNDRIIEGCVTYYKNLFQATPNEYTLLSILQATHEEGREKAMKILQESAALEKHKPQMKTQLENCLNEEFRNILQTNDNTFEKIAENLVQITVDSYTSSIKKYVIFGTRNNFDIFYKPEYIKKISSSAVSNAVNHFKEHFEDFGYNISVAKKIGYWLQVLADELKKVYNDILGINSAVSTKSVKTIQKDVAITLQTYTNKLAFFSAQMPLMSPYRLSILHKMKMDHEIRKFNDKPKPGDIEFQTGFANILEDQIEKQFEKIMQQHTSQAGFVSSGLETFQESLLQKFQEKIIEAQTRIHCVADMRPIFNDQASNTVEEFERKDNFPSDVDLVSNLVKSLRNQMHESYLTLVVNF